MIYYTNTENINQTYDNQILQTEKNHFNDNEFIIKNLQSLRKDNISANKNSNKLMLQNLTIESDSNHLIVKSKKLFIFIEFPILTKFLL